MANENTYRLKLLRNDLIFETREEALSNIQTEALNRADGEPWIASYGTTPNVKSLFVIKREGGITIIDSEKINDLITNLNYTDEAVAKKFVTSVSETDGIISVNRGEITSNDKTITLDDGDDGGIDFSVNIDGTTVVKDNNDGKLSVQINSTEKVLSKDNGGLKTIIGLKKVTTGLTANVKEQYQLVGIDGTTQLGNVAIDIYKDSALLAAKLSTLDATWDSTNNVIVNGSGEEALALAYEDKNGTVQVVTIPVGDFLRESEFADGLEIDNHVVKVKPDTTSNDAESFISVSTNGVKISGVQNAIDNAINALDATVGSTTVATGKHVAVQVVETDGVLTALNITEDDIASEAALIENERVISEALNDLEERKADKTDILGQVNEGNGIEVSAISQNEQTISIKLDGVHKYRLIVSPYTIITAAEYDALSTADKQNYEIYEDNGLILTADGLYLPNIIDCGTY